MRLLALLAVLVALPSCASFVENELPPTPHCLPGRQLACDCPDGILGVTDCEADGVTWTACACTAGGAV